MCKEILVRLYVRLVETKNIRHQASKLSENKQTSEILINSFRFKSSRQTLEKKDRLDSYIDYSVCNILCNKMANAAETFKEFTSTESL